MCQENRRQNAPIAFYTPGIDDVMKIPSKFLYPQSLLNEYYFAIKNAAIFKQASVNKRQAYGAYDGDDKTMS